MDRKTMADELDRIALAIMEGTATLADPVALQRMAYELRTPEEREVEIAKTEIELEGAAAALGRKGGASKTPAKSAASRANGARGGRPRYRLLSDDGQGRKLYERNRRLGCIRYDPDTLTTLESTSDCDGWDPDGIGYTPMRPEELADLLEWERTH